MERLEKKTLEAQFLKRDPDEYGMNDNSLAGQNEAASI
jgi:hypothetical protein